MPQRKFLSLEDWLLRVDPAGSLQKYLADLQENFDCAEQLVDAYVSSDYKTGRARLDERIFEDLGFKEPQDQQKLEAWFIRETGTEPRKHQFSQVPPQVARPPGLTEETSGYSITSVEDWLRRVDPTGNLWSASYHAVLEHFDCAEQVIEAYTEVIEPSGQVILDPQIFTDFCISMPSQQGAQMALSAWFSAAAASGMADLIRACRDEIPVDVPTSRPVPGGASPEKVLRGEYTNGSSGSPTQWRLSTGLEEESILSTPAEVIHLCKPALAAEASASPPVEKPSKPVKPTRPGMTPREEALRPWCAQAGVTEEVLYRLRSEDVWHPEDLLHLDKPALADIVQGMKKGVQGRFFSAVHNLKKAKGLVPASPRSADVNGNSPNRNDSA